MPYIGLTTSKAKAQEHDLLLYKIFCGTKETLKSHPSDTHRLTMYFPLDEDKPRFICLPCDARGVGHKIDRPRCRNLLKTGYGFCGTKAIIIDWALGRENQRDPELLSHDEKLDDERLKPSLLGIHSRKVSCGRQAYHLAI